ncbi:MAG: phosphogluconate dehydrogenase (NAD(+)-dependent, decarboxylating), partial [Candidatus Paceibacteria bacterium]
PAGEIVDQTLEGITPYLSKDDIVIDGGNSYYQDTLERAAELAEHGIEYVDAGTSGGLRGEEIGYSMMIGGTEETVAYLDPIFKTLAIEEGYDHMGDVGSGHYVKMVHNAIEYGIMQSMAEGFELLKNGPFEDVDLERITHVWNHGSIIRSYLMELAETAFRNEGDLERIEDYVDDSGEGRWAVQTAIEHAVPFTVNTHAVYARFRSRQEESFGAKTLAALRNEFGGHEVKTENEKE